LRSVKNQEIADICGLPELALSHHNNPCLPVFNAINHSEDDRGNSVGCSVRINSITNSRHQSYKAQQVRGLSRKARLVEPGGAECSRCGYAKNLSALEFHHKNPVHKSFQLDLRSLSNRSWEKIREEFVKCVLLCSNCHREAHNPQLSLKVGQKDGPELQKKKPGIARLLLFAAEAAPTRTA
jgi:hypothetical protein